MHATASACDMLGLTSTVSAAAGTRNATVCSRFRTFVTDRPRATSASANQPVTCAPVTGLGQLYSATALARFAVISLSYLQLSYRQP